MPTSVVMPQMGESIAEGTIVRWIKKVGDSVERDEPLFEITTDKVDAEIPAPAAGVLTEIKVKEGETVAVNTVVGTIGQPGERPEPASETPAAGVREKAEVAAASTQSQGDGDRPRAPGPAASASPDDVRQRRSSPLVRRIARDNNVDIAEIRGSGIGGRVTKSDILAHLDRPQARPQASGPRDQGSLRDQGSGIRDQSSQAQVGAASQGAEARPATGQEARPGAMSTDRVEIQPLSPMRKIIAERMVLSRRTSAHVHSVFHVDFSHVEKIRRENKEEYARLGARLTYMAFIASAVIDAIRHHPIINASLDGENVIYKKNVHLGIAVALESGLIVPVISNADEKNLLGLSRAIADIADRARTKQLRPEEVQGGTFTITNPGQFGAQFGMPIINQPQVAILGVGTIEKRPVVIDEAIAIRTMAYLTLGYDHRLVDGAVADQFMANVKRHLESFDVDKI
ncbi:MAG: dihydrolipoamide acetyltransferase family protein [Vicinamibacterales bacterium]